MCAGVVLMPTSIVRTAAVPILEPVQSAGAGRLSVNLPSTGATRSRLVNVNLYPLPTPGTSARSREDDLELALFPDVTVRAVFERFETVGGSGTWVGHVEGVPMSSVTLAYRDGLLTGSINTHEGTFDIRPGSAGRRAARRRQAAAHRVRDGHQHAAAWSGHDDGAGSISGGRTLAFDERG